MDQFAERLGDQVWQTVITKVGLDTLHRLLRKSARKNTAVACHWIRGKNHSELLWIVGDRSCFNEQGSVPTGSSKTDILRKDSENTWHSLRLIRLLTGLAALMHDLGKAGKAFQEMLEPKVKALKSIYRHEWISLRLFQAFVGDCDDAGWLRRLYAPCAEDDQSWIARLYKDGLDSGSASLNTMPPLARTVAWLFLSHHRLPSHPEKDYIRNEDQFEHLWKELTSEWNQRTYSDADSSERKPQYSPVNKEGDLKKHWNFPNGLPITLPEWRKRATGLAEELLRLLEGAGMDAPLQDPFVMHLARLCLMMGDHLYSSLEDPLKQVKGNPDCLLYANTSKKTNELRQKLDEHLLGVEKYADKAARSLPYLAAKLAHLPRNKKLRARSGGDFHWQDKAMEMAGALRRQTEIQGAFIVNLASTGCGKTLANLKIMYALADESDSNDSSGLRCSFALGLRVLTRQTGEEYRDRLGLGDDVVAVLAGGAATQKLYEHRQEEDHDSASADPDTFLNEDAEVLYMEDGRDNAMLRELFTESDKAKARRLLEAPLLCCTIDHLMPAVESLRGGRQILPMLRLLSGDLVLDELDDYDIEDLPALTRLVFWAGLLGSRVLISSATIPPAFAEGMFAAYLAGRRHFQRNRGERPFDMPPVSCIWLDEFHTRNVDCTDAATFRDAHRAFAEKRRDKLQKAPVHRRAELRRLEDAAPDKLPALFSRHILESACILHDRYHIMDDTGSKRVSFGLVRMANIRPLFLVAQELFRQGAPQGRHIHLCVYHSQFPLILRAGIEQQLDQTLKRKDNRNPCSSPAIRRLLESPASAGVKDHIFIVLVSPVAEVGRDHDYDWAVVEPSSMRSIIQIVGRVWRHRLYLECVKPNIILLDRNYRSLERPGQPAYRWPGFENEDFRLREHSLSDLLREEEYKTITSVPRLLPSTDFDFEQRLSDLEHERLQRILIAQSPSGTGRRGGGSSFVGAYSCWRHPWAMLSGMLQKRYPFREEVRKETELYLRPDEEGENYQLHRLLEKKNGQAVYDVPVSKLLEEVNLDCGHGISIWGFKNDEDYLIALKESADTLDIDLQTCARIYGSVTLPDSPQGWFFHPALGFVAK